MKVKLIAGSLLLLSLWLLSYFFKDKTRDFDYADLSFDKRKLSCKYIKFREAEKIHLNKGVSFLGNKTSYPQWVKYINFMSYETELSKEFRPEFFLSLTDEEIEDYKSKWPLHTDNNKKRADAVREASTEEQFALLEGLLFLKFDDMEFVVFDYLLNKDDSVYSNRHIAFYNKGVKLANNRKYKFIEKFAGLPEIDALDKASFISKLSAHPESLLLWEGAPLELDLDEFCQ